MNYTVKKYGADWCHGCKVMDKIMPKVLESKTGILYEKVDIDALSESEREALTAAYGKSIPLLVLSDASGTVLGVQQGAKSITQTSAFLSSFIGC